MPHSKSATKPRGSQPGALHVHCSGEMLKQSHLPFLPCQWLLPWTEAPWPRAGVPDGRQCTMVLHHSAQAQEGEEWWAEQLCSCIARIKITQQAGEPWGTLWGLQWGRLVVCICLLFWPLHHLQLQHEGCKGRTQAQQAAPSCPVYYEHHDEHIAAHSKKWDDGRQLCFQGIMFIQYLGTCQLGWHVVDPSLRDTRLACEGLQFCMLEAPHIYLSSEKERPPRLACSAQPNPRALFGIASSQTHLPGLVNACSTG